MNPAILRDAVMTSSDSDPVVLGLRCVWWRAKRNKKGPVQMQMDAACGCGHTQYRHSVFAFARVRDF